MSNKGQLLQDPFLNALRKEHIPVSIYLVNGIKLQGQIESFDQYVVLLRNTVTQMVYKHAISTVVPARPVNLSCGVRNLTVFQVESERAGRSERALLVSVATGRRDDPDAVEELTQLVQSAGLMPAGHLAVRRDRPDPAHYVGARARSKKSRRWRSRVTPVWWYSTWRCRRRSSATSSARSGSGCWTAPR